MKDKINIYVDCDDTILHSSETVIDILNKRYRTNKTINDLKDWNYRSIVSTITQDEILDIYCSDEFWDNVKNNEKFLAVYNKLKDKVNWVVVSKGNYANLLKKQEYLDKHFDNIYFYGLLINGANDFNKSYIDMSDGIQIDDNINCLLSTNSSLKIIIRNYRDVYWNRIPAHVDNLYSVDDWKQIDSILDFMLENREFVVSCYIEGDEKI